MIQYDTLKRIIAWSVPKCKQLLRISQLKQRLLRKRKCRRVPRVFSFWLAFQSLQNLCFISRIKTSARGVHRKYKMLQALNLINLLLDNYAEVDERHIRTAPFDCAMILA